MFLFPNIQIFSQLKIWQTEHTELFKETEITYHVY